MHVYKYSQQNDKKKFFYFKNKNLIMLICVSINVLDF